MKLKTSVKAFLAILTLVMVLSVTVATPFTAFAAGDLPVEFTEIPMTGFFNPQYGVTVDGQKANMSAFNQMEVGNHMFVIVVNSESQKLLTSTLDKGQCTVKDLNSSVYNVDAESEKDGSFLRYAWLFVKVDDNKFQLRPAFATAGRLTVNGVSVVLEDKADLESPDEDSSWAWTVEQMSESNGALVALKHIETDGYLSHGSDNKVVISADLSTTPALQWNVLPIFQSINPYTVYGFAQAGSEIAILNRTTYAEDVIKSLKTSFTAMNGNGAVTYNGGGSVADLFITKDLEKATDGDATTQMFAMTNYGIQREIAKTSEVEDKQDPQFMLWEINTTDHACDGPDTFESLALEVNGDSLKFAEDKDTAEQRFIIVYSMTADGGYYLVPVGTNGFKVYSASGEALSLTQASKDYNADNALWVTGCRYQNDTANDTLALTIKDVIVKPEGDGYVIVEGKDALGKYVFANDKYEFEFDDQAFFSGTGEECSYNKLAVGTIISAKLAEYSGYAASSYDGYELVGYTSINVVPDNDKNVCYRYFISLGGDVEDESKDESKDESTDASAEASNDASEENNTTDETSKDDNSGDDFPIGLIIGIVVAVVVIVVVVVVVVVSKKKKQ